MLVNPIWASLSFLLRSKLPNNYQECTGARPLCNRRLEAQLSGSVTSLFGFVDFSGVTIRLVKSLSGSVTLMFGSESGYRSFGVMV